MMGPEQFKPQVPANMIKPESKQWQMIIGICGMVHFGLVFMMFFLYPMGGIYEMFDIMILFCAASRMDYCCLLCYVLNITISFFYNFNTLGKAAQNGEWGKIYSGD